MKYYVTDLLFTADKEHVLLGEEPQPAWQIGELNRVSRRYQRYF